MPVCAQPAWTPPPRFDGFEIVRPLGTGGMGVVYLARDTRLDRQVAIKMVAHPERPPHAAARFAVEVRALARVRHPNVVTVYRAGKVDHRPYLAQELLVGERLDELVRPAPWPRVLAIGRGLARAVAAAHACGVIHRDIKPANVMLVGGRRVKLFDFGLALFVDAAATKTALGEPGVLAMGSGRWDARLTADGGIAGTPAYLAPELWNGGLADVRSDAYALGLVLYELLAGDLPHAHLAGEDIGRAVCLCDLPRVASVRPDVPAALGALIDRSVARDPAQRPPSVAAIRDELDALGATCRPASGAWRVDGEPLARRAAPLDSLPTEPVAVPVARCAK